MFVQDLIYLRAEDNKQLKISSEVQLSGFQNPPRRGVQIIMGNRLFVGNLAYSVTDEDLKEFFSEVGEVVSAQVSIDRDSRKSRGFGFVEMSSDEEAKAAIDKKHDQELLGRKVSVDFSRPKSDNRDRNSGYSNNRDRGNRDQNSSFRRTY